MKYKVLSEKTMRRILSLVMTVILLPLPGYFHGLAAQAAETAISRNQDYIVCYREGSGYDSVSPQKEDGQVPFDVVDGRELRHLLREDCLEWYEEDGEAVLLEDVNDPTADISWNLAMIGAEDQALGEYRGQGVRVGVLDSGVSPHPDLAASLLQGYNYIPDTKEPENTEDRFGHGTKVAGLIAASGGESRIGAAPDAYIVPLKCTDGKTVKISVICRAIYGGIDDYGCEVLNLSLGVQTDYQSLREAVAYAEEKGVTVVSAVGNSGNSTEYYPAAYDSVIGVGSVDRGENWYSRSNYNRSVFVTAPGVEVLSTSRDGGYEEGTGCSFAVPQASAAAAVLRSIDPSVSPEKIKRIISQTARDKGQEGYDTYYGYGILNIGACISALTAGSDDPDDPPVPCDGGPDCPLRAFADLNSGDWYHDGIHYVLDNGIMYGLGDGRFGPQETLSRAMIVTMLWRMENKPASEYTLPFIDIEKDAWYTDGLRWAASEKLVAGYSEQLFGPEDNITREQLAAILYRFAKYKGGTGPEEEASAFTIPDTEPFTDSGDVSEWAEEAVRWCIGKGILRGDDERKLRPQASVTRAESAAMLARLQGTDS